MDNIDLASSNIDTGLLQFSLTIQIERGLNGIWGVKHASIGPQQSPNEQEVNIPKSTTHETGPDSTDQNNIHLGFAKPNRARARAQRPKRVHRPTRQKWAWRPKPRSHTGSSRPGSATMGPAMTLTPHIPESPPPSLENSKSDVSSSQAVPITDIIPHPNEVVTRTWGTSSEWVLELRGGRRLSIPVSLLRPQLGEFQAPKPRLPTGLGEASGGGELLGLSRD
ncbi:hypothetical protein FCV25MIE_16743 [Fagus crenata]